MPVNSSCDLCGDALATADLWDFGDLKACSACVNYAHESTGTPMHPVLKGLLEDTNHTQED